MINYNCQFLEPVNLGNASKPDYEYSVLNCTSTENNTTTNSLTLIQNSETGAEFYLDKTINYGEILILIFFFLFAVFGIVKVIMDFWIPHKIDFKKF